MTMLNSLNAIVSPPGPSAPGRTGQASVDEATGFAKAMTAAQGEAEGAASRPDAIDRADGGKASASDADVEPVMNASAEAMSAHRGKPARSTAGAGAAPSGKGAVTDESAAMAAAEQDADAPAPDDDGTLVMADAPTQPVMIVQAPSAPLQPTATVAGEAKATVAGSVTLASPATGTANGPASQALESGAPATAEAAALLQLVRDHVSGNASRGGDGKSAEAATTPALDGTTEGGQPASATPTLTAAPTPQTAVAQSAAAMPVVNLSASLGDSVVDIGVSGQWLDGLARDIAGLSAHGAQGRFQINTDQLGAVQVDIRQGADGAAVSLTVASAAAELALRQDSDRLKLDAGLSAVRISDVKVERAPHVADAARADTTGHQTQSQQEGQQGQSSAQSQMRGRGQSRENILPASKGSGDAVVLNHEQAGDAGADLPRARYA